MVILFTLTIFSGAALLFLIQPVVGRMVLPLLGGAPAIWNTAMFFFQALLLAGYAYTHFSSRRLGVRRQVPVHLVLLLVPLLFLPIGVGPGWQEPAAGSPVLWMLCLLAAIVGAPFFVLSATSPLLQRWFAASGHKSANDPYFLYAASNSGSLLALIAYPILIEPNLRVQVQSWWWGVGYCIFAVLVAVCGLLARQATQTAPLAVKSDVPDVAGPLTIGRRVRWAVLAMLPCSLMLSVTTYLTSELAPVPLLWVIPLALFLITFILVFSKRRLLPQRWFVHALPIASALVLYLLMTSAARPIGLLAGLHLACFFIVAMACHGELSSDRPQVEHLTEFYFWISLGGLLGGMVNALLAPLVFNSLAEYPWTLIVVSALVPVTATLRMPARSWLRDLGTAILVGVFALVLVNFLPAMAIGGLAAKTAVVYGVLLLVCLLFVHQPRRFALALTAVLAVNSAVPKENERTLLAERTFFGIHRVMEDRPGQFHQLLHGNTVHGAQLTDAAWRHEPLTYYTRSGPFGQGFAALPASLKQRVGVIGLGAGSLAAYAAGGQRWTFYEIDPVVERIARDPKYFTFLSDSAAHLDVVLGDARLTLARTADRQFGLLVVDAFNSDTVPLHLITREALALYQRKLADDGVLLVHISNRHLWLERVFAALAQDAGWPCMVRADVVTNPNAFKLSSKWVILAKSKQSFGQLAVDAGWQMPPPGLKTAAVWTDDYAGIFSVFKW